MEHLAQYIESLIFSAEQPISLQDISTCLRTTFETAISDEEILQAIDEIKSRYQQEAFSFEIAEIAGGYQFLTKPAYHGVVSVYLRQTTKKRLSQAALETLSIIAYKQPVSKTELEQIRGVSCDYSIQKLLEKELVVITGRSDTPGRPLLYGTSDKFMNYFGIKSLLDLPKPKDFKNPGNMIGDERPIEEISNG